MYVKTFYDIIRQYNRRIKIIFKEYNLSQNEVKLLIHLLKYPDVDNSMELSHDLGISQSLICRYVSSLTRKGLLNVKVDTFDRRINRLSASVKDEQLKKLLLEFDTNFEKILIKNVSDDNMYIFKSILNQMTNNLKERK